MKKNNENIEEKKEKNNDEKNKKDKETNHNINNNINNNIENEDMDFNYFEINGEKKCFYQPVILRLIIFLMD